MRRFLLRILLVFFLATPVITSLEGCAVNKCDTCPHGDGSKPKKTKRKKH